jgi:putative membrane protein
VSAATTSIPRPPSDRPFFVFNALLSTAALAFLAWILLLRKASPDASASLGFLPAVNAGLNALAASFLVAGYVAIKRKAQRVHKYCMVSAFVASSLFLVCYVVYHYVHGDTRFQGTGAVRVVYLTVLSSHVLLSMSVVPLALTSFYFAFRRAFGKHKKLTRWALPIWLYVSVTGVLIFFMLRGSAPAL